MERTPLYDNIGSGIVQPVGNLTTIMGCKIWLCP
jgi:hypothetical protein